MIELFMLEFCGYCKKVIAYLDEHNIPYKTIDISDKANEEELIRIGGRRQVPFLLDRENKVEMYESGDIIEYLREFPEIQYVHAVDRRSGYEDFQSRPPYVCGCRLPGDRKQIYEDFRNSFQGAYVLRALPECRSVPALSNMKDRGRALAILPGCKRSVALR